MKLPKALTSRADRQASLGERLTGAAGRARSTEVLARHRQALAGRPIPQHDPL